MQQSKLNLLAFLLGLALLAAPVQSEAGDRFLTLPFARQDPPVLIQQGWVYNWSNPPAHEGIDFIKGPLDQSRNWRSFSVKAAFSGTVHMIQPAWDGKTQGWGRYVILKHVVTDNSVKPPVTTVYYTLYAHLLSVAQNLTVGANVARGSTIAIAGDTGTTAGVHLHFEAYKKDLARASRIDPFGIHNTRQFYPGNNPKSLFTTSPPSFP